MVVCLKILVLRSLDSIEAKFKESKKAETGTLMNIMITTKYIGEGVREHIMSMADVAAIRRVKEFRGVRDTHLNELIATGRERDNMTQKQILPILPTKERNIFRESITGPMQE